MRRDSPALILTAMSEIKDSILDTIGETPLVRLSRIGAGPEAPDRRQARGFNPGGSIKDRVAIRLVEAAEKDGRLKPGGTIIEPTSGNTGTGLAIAARLKGYRVIAVMPDKMCKEKIDLLRAYGAEVVVAPTDVSPDSPRPTTASPTASPATSPAPSSPTSTPTRPTRRRTTRPRGRAVAADRRQGHAPRRRRRDGRHDHRDGPLLKEQNPDIEIIGADPGGLDLLQPRGPSLPRRGRGRGLLARDLRPEAWSIATSPSATATASSPRAAWPRRRACSSAARAASRLHTALEVDARERRRAER